MRLKEVCKNYFTIQHPSQKDNKLTLSEKAIRIGKIVSYCLFVPPLIMGILYGSCALKGRVKKNNKAQPNQGASSQGNTSFSTKKPASSSNSKPSKPVKKTSTVVPSYSPSNLSSLVNAIDADDWDLIKKLLKKTPSLPALFIAIEKNKIAIAENLINLSSINLGAQNDIGATVLHIAASQPNNQYLIKLLLEKMEEEEINKVAKNGGTAFHAAVFLGDKENINVFFSNKKCDVNKKTDNNDQFTPLHLAVVQNKGEVVDILLEKEGIKVNEPDAKGNPPLHVAIEIGEFPLVKRLLENKDIDVNAQNNGNGRTPLHTAVIEEAYDCIEVLLEQDKVNFKLVDENGNTALNIADIKGDSKTITMFLNKMVALTDEGESPLDVIQRFGCEREGIYPFLQNAVEHDLEIGKRIAKELFEKRSQDESIRQILKEQRDGISLSAFLSSYGWDS